MVEQGQALDPGADCRIYSYFGMLWPQPMRWGYSSMVYCESWTSRSAPPRKLHQPLVNHVVAEQVVTDGGPVEGFINRWHRQSSSYRV